MAAFFANGTEFVPRLDGGYINLNDCIPDVCSLSYAQLLYIPSFAGNLTYLILFALILLAQAYLGVLGRTWGFMFGMLCGLVLEIVGYVGRIELYHNVFSFNAFVTYLVCLTIAPAFISASVYACLSRLIVVYGASIVRFSPRTYTLVFVSCDIVSLVLQAAGGAVAATATAGSSGGQTGVNIMIAGLSFQVASLLAFMVLGVVAGLAIWHAMPSQLNPSFMAVRRRRTFMIFPWAIALATVLIFIRCCFRVAELQDGFGGPIANDQVLFMVFEGPMIIVATLVLTIFHPGSCIGGAANWKAANWTWKRARSYDSESKVDNNEYISLENQSKSGQSELA